MLSSTRLVCSRSLPSLGPGDGEPWNRPSRDLSGIVKKAVGFLEFFLFFASHIDIPLRAARQILHPSNYHD